MRPDFAGRTSVRPTQVSVLTAALILFTTACSVGPKYSRPLTPMTPVFKELPPGNDQWKASTPRDGELKGKWWEMFGDPQLNALEEQVSISNQGLKQAEAIFRQAQGLVAAARANAYPVITTNPGISTTGTGASRSSSAGNRGSGVSTVFTVPFTASWAPDLWGRVRLNIEN